jgi:phospholipid-translocating ATPase
LKSQNNGIKIYMRRVKFDYQRSSNSEDEYDSGYNSRINPVLRFLSRFLISKARKYHIGWFIVVSVLQTMQVEGYSEWWSTVLLVSIIILFALIRAFKAFRLKFDTLKSQSKRVCLVWEDQSFVESVWAEVKIGQAVLIREMDLCPAPLLLIAVGSEDNTCYIDSFDVIGETSLECKKPIVDSQRLLKHNNFKTAAINIKRLSGWIQLEEGDQKVNVFRGKIKFRGFPKSSRISYENQIPRGSKLISGSWAIGISLDSYSVYQARISDKLFESPTSLFETNLNKIVLCLFCVMIGLVIISSSICIALSEDVGSDYISIRNVFIRFILLYKNIIPVSGFFVLFLLRYIQKRVIQSSFIDKISIPNFEVLEDLGKVDYLLLDKTGTLTEAKNMLKMCVIRNGIYYHEENNISSTVELCNSEDESEREPLSNGPFHTRKFGSVVFPFGYDNLNFSHLRGESEEEEFVEHFIKSMLFCVATTQIQPDDFIITKSDDKAITSSTKKLGYKILNRSKSFIHLEEHGMVTKYDVLIYHQSFDPYLKTRAVVKKGNTIYLYIKTDKQFIHNYIDNQEDFEVIGEHFNILKSSGFKSLSFWFRRFRTNEAKVFKSKLQQVMRNQLNSNYRIEQLFNEYEKNMTYLGSIGIEEEILLENKEAISALMHAGVKPWLLSGDDEASTLSSAILSNLLPSQAQVISLLDIKSPEHCARLLYKHIKRNIFNDRFVRTNEYLPPSMQFEPHSAARRRSYKSLESLEFNLLKNHFVNSFRDSLINEMNKDALIPIKVPDTEVEYVLNKPVDFDQIRYALLIDSCTLEAALKDENCKKMLVIMLYCAKAVCFCNMQPDTKASLVRLLKNHIEYGPTVMAVGDNNSDLAMLSEADIKVCISDKNSDLMERMADIEIKSISQIRELLLSTGLGIYDANSRVILLYFFINFTITMITFVYTLISNYSGTPIFNESEILMINLLFCIFPILFIGLYDRFFSYTIQFGMFDFYAKLRTKKSLGLKSLLFSILHSIVVTIIIILFISEALNSTLNHSGYTENIELLQISCLISLVLCSLSKITFTILHFRSSFYIYLLLSLIALVTYIVISTLYLLPTSPAHFYSIGFELSDSPILLISVLLCPIIYLTFLLFLYFYEKNFNLRKAYESLFTRARKYKSDISQIYRNSFKSHSERQSFQVSPISLHFGSPQIEAQYRKKYIMEDLKIIRSSALLFFILHVGWIIIEVLIYNTNTDLLILMILFSGVYPILILVSYTRFIYKLYIPLTISGIAVLLVMKTVLEIEYSNSGYLSSICVPTVTYIFLNIEFLPICVLNLENIVLVMLSLYSNLSSDLDDPVEIALLMMIYLIYLLATTVVSLLIGYSLGKSRRYNFQLMEMIASEIQNSQNILSFLLPSFVKKRVKDGVRYIAEDQGVVSVLFCDICDFDKICAMYSPQELTDFLDELFQNFDMLCEELGVTKIETVGKTYMACAGLKDSEEEIQHNLENLSHANRTIELAFRILNTIENIKLSNGDNLQVKIGINSGPVVAGVVGYHKPQFSLIGDTVNTASRMCSTLQEPNKIQISTETYDCIEESSNIEFQPNHIIAKGKGEMSTYIVTEKSRECITFHLDPPTISIKESGVSIENSPKSILESTKLSLPLNISYNHPSSLRIRSVENTHKENSILSNLEGQLDIYPAQVYDLSINTNAIEGVSLTQNHKETPNEREFRLNYVESIQHILRKSMAACLVTFCLVYLLNLLMYFFIPNMISWHILILKPIIIISQLVILIFFSKIYKTRRFGLITTLLYVAGALISMLFILLDLEMPNQFVALEFMYFILLINSSGVFFGKAIWGVISISFIWVAIMGSVDNYADHALSTIFVVGYAVTNAIAIYNKEKLIRYYSNLKTLAQSEICKTDDLLTQMLPPHVLNSLKQDDQITDKLMDVTLLYADIVGFTEWSSNKTPAMVVSMLSNLFTRFDKLSVIHEVYKVYTIGDCYVVMGYTGKSEISSAQQCLNVIGFAESMLEIIDDVNRESESSLKMRIGVHTGEVIAGIIGTKIVRYDIYGPDVLIANKMESGGKPGTINVSDVTMNLIQSVHPYRYEFEFNKDIVAESIKRMHKSYYIV